MALNQTEIDAIQALLDAGVSQQDREQIEQQLLNEGLVVDSSNQIVPQNVPQPTTPAVPVVGTPQVDLMQSAFALIQQALLSQQGGVSENEVNTIIKKYLTNEKVQKPELSDDLLNFIQQTKKIEVMIYSQYQI